MDTKNLKFSGHESFHCRPFWLKKGFDHVSGGKPFNDEAGVELGVGRNMVGSIRFWMKAFDLIDDNDNLTHLAEKIFSDKGWDPFLEDDATLWLLHYKLSSKKYSSIYNIIFSEIRKVKPEFSKQHFIARINELDSSQSENIVGKDFSVFTRSYFAKPSTDKEESFSGLFTDLELLSEVGEDSKKNQLYHVSNRRQTSIPWQIILFCILDNDSYNDSISFKSLMLDENGIGNLFALSQEGLENKLIEIDSNNSDIIYRNDAGVKELQFKNGKPSKFEILNRYYENEK